MTNTETDHDSHAPSNRSAVLMQRIIAGISVTFALLIMANMFSPGDSMADTTHDDGHSEEISTGETYHQVGTLEDRSYRVDVFTGEAGTRYTVISRKTGKELLTLGTKADVEALVPHLNIPTVADSPNGDGMQLMYAENEAIH